MIITHEKDILLLEANDARHVEGHPPLVLHLFREKGDDFERAITFDRALKIGEGVGSLLKADDRFTPQVPFENFRNRDISCGIQGALDDDAGLVSAGQHVENGQPFCEGEGSASEKQDEDHQHFHEFYIKQERIDTCQGNVKEFAPGIKGGMNGVKMRGNSLRLVNHLFLARIRPLELSSCEVKLGMALFNWCSKAVFSVLALTSEIVAGATEVDYSHFHDLAPAEQGKIIWNLHENKEWGKPEQKPIVQAILITQMPGEANYMAWVDDAIAMAEKYEWKELNPLIAAIHDQPHSPYINQRAFLSVRMSKGDSVSAEISADANVIRDAGFYHTPVTNEELQAACNHLIEQPDHDAVVTYLLTVVVQNSGKGGTERGHLEAWGVLNAEPPEIVRRELDKALKNYNSFYQEELQRALAVRAKESEMQREKGL